MVKIILYIFLFSAIYQQAIHQNLLRIYVVMGVLYILNVEYIAQGELCQIFFKTLSIEIYAVVERSLCTRNQIRLFFH